MCGFVAFLQNAPIFDIETARRTLDTITHRGPDAEGEWCEREVMLLHRRLSIIDLATGDQPMQSRDGRYVIVFNGEIYNFPQLRDELSDKGVQFHTHSDTEVILEGYAYWGAEVLARLHGMFAFVIWDRHLCRVFTARDRLGIKPLCWARYGGALIVASTLEPFKYLEAFDKIDLVAVRDLMAFDYIPSPRTILKNVNKLDPGSYFLWHLGEPIPTITHYWRSPLSKSSEPSPDEYELEELLDRAVARQMISDVPIGAFLSGGIDSSLLVAFMARHSEQPVRTFSCAFADSLSDESHIAKQVASQFGTDHVVLRAEDVGPKALLELLGCLDEPFADPAVVPTLALSKMTASHVRVALSGDGADEVFGGYPKYLQGGVSQSAFPLSSLLHRALRAVPWKSRFAQHVYWRTLSFQDRIQWSWLRFGDFPVFPKDITQLFSPSYHQAAKLDQVFLPWEQRAKRFGKVYDMDVLMRTDLEMYLSENCLVKTDRASMLASLEVRVPYLDETVLDRLLPVHADRKIVNRELKSLLMPVARRLLPKEVWDRPKHGFGVPLNIWLAGNWRPAVEEALEWGEAHVDLFNYSYLRRLHKMNMVNPKMARQLWNPFIFLAWMMNSAKKI